MAKSKQPPAFTSGKDSTSKPVATKVKGGRGYIAGTDIPNKAAHNQRRAIYWLQARRKRVASRYLRGWTQWEIAKKEGVDQAVVSADLEVIYKVWQEEMLASFDQHKRNQLAKIDYMEQVAYTAYVKSIGIRKVITREKTVGGMYGETNKVKIVRDDLAGDTKYLDQVKWCIEMRCKILGITKDVKNVNVGLLSLNWEDISTDNGADAINNQILELEAHTSNKDSESNNGDSK